MGSVQIRSAWWIAGGAVALMLVGLISPLSWGGWASGIAYLLVSNALVGAALALGANLEIDDTPGYAPCVYDEQFALLALDAIKEVLPNVPCHISKCISTGSSDIGDLTMLMPAIQPSMMGAEGQGHGATYYITDPELAVVGAAKWQLAMLRLLLCNNAERAKRIISDYKPTFASKEEYFAFLERFRSSGPRINYEADRSAHAYLK
jgi:hypothetical protein